MELIMADDQSTDQTITLFCFAWSDWLTDCACYMSSLRCPGGFGSIFTTTHHCLKEGKPGPTRITEYILFSNMKISKRRKSERLEYTNKWAFLFFVAYGVKLTTSSPSRLRFFTFASFAILAGVKEASLSNTQRQHVNIRPQHLNLHFHSSFTCSRHWKHALLRLLSKGRSEPNRRVYLSPCELLSDEMSTNISEDVEQQLREPFLKSRSIDAYSLTN
jgi:hypothetical protein